MCLSWNLKRCFKVLAQILYDRLCINFCIVCRWSMPDFIPTTLSSTGDLFSLTHAFQDSSEHSWRSLSLSQYLQNIFFADGLVLGRLFAEGSPGVWGSQLFVQVSDHQVIFIPNPMPYNCDVSLWHALFREGLWRNLGECNSLWPCREKSWRSGF